MLTASEFKFNFIGITADKKEKYMNYEDVRMLNCILLLYFEYSRRTDEVSDNGH